MIWELAPPGEMPEVIGDCMLVTKGTNMKAYNCGKGKTRVQSKAEPEFSPYVRRLSKAERQCHGEVVRVEKNALHKVIRCKVTRTLMKTN